MCRLEPDKRNRCLFFVDDGLIKARPELVEDIKAYAAHHVSELELVTDPIAVPGGEKIKSNLVKEKFNKLDGMIVPGGFGERGIEGKLISISYARKHNIPYLGICL